MRITETDILTPMFEKQLVWNNSAQRKRRGEFHVSDFVYCLECARLRKLNYPEKEPSFERRLSMKLGQIHHSLLEFTPECPVEFEGVIGNIDSIVAACPMELKTTRGFIRENKPIEEQVSEHYLVQLGYYQAMKNKLIGYVAVLYFSVKKQRKDGNGYQFVPVILQFKVERTPEELAEIRKELLLKKSLLLKGVQTDTPITQFSPMYKWECSSPCGFLDICPLKQKKNAGNEKKLLEELAAAQARVKELQVLVANGGQPIEKPAERPDNPGKPIEKPASKPVEKPVAKPAKQEKPEEKPVARPTTNPDKPAKKIVKKPVGNPKVSEVSKSPAPSTRPPVEEPARKPVSYPAANQPEKASPKQLAYLRHILSKQVEIKDTKQQDQYLLEFFKIKNLGQITKQAAWQAISKNLLGHAERSG